MAAGAAGVARSARETAPLRRTSNSRPRAVDSLKCGALAIYWLALWGRALSANEAQVCTPGGKGADEKCVTSSLLLPLSPKPGMQLADPLRSRRPRMQLAVLWTLLASSSALSPGARPRTCRREALCGAAATVLSLAATPTPVFADYGQAAGQKLPAFVPSPIRPTGEMAKTCEIVALGREVAAARSKGFQREPR